MTNVQIDYPNQTSQWGKMLIDILNTDLSKVHVQEHIKMINANLRLSRKVLKKLKLQLAQH